MLLKPHPGGHLPYSYIKIEKLNTQAIFKIMFVHPYLESLSKALYTIG